MKARYTAIFAAVMLLVSVSGCGSKPSTIESQEPVPFTDQLSDVTAEPETDAEGSAEDTEETRTPASTDSASPLDTAAAPAAAASAPVDVGSDAPQAVTMAPTVDPSNIAAPPANADDDQMGELGADATAPPVETHADKNAATAPANQPTEKAASGKLATKGGSANGKLQITVQTAEITLDQLKKQNYTVDLLVSLDQNPGITYSEWGLNLDSRCTYTGDVDDLPIQTVFDISNEAHFLWTAWTNGTSSTKTTGGILRLHIKLPADAAAGSTYPVTYADTSRQPAPHIWQGNTKDWVGTKEVGWTNGGVIVK